MSSNCTKLMYIKKCLINIWNIILDVTYNLTLMSQRLKESTISQ